MYLLDGDGNESYKLRTHNITVLDNKMDLGGMMSNGNVKVLVPDRVFAVAHDVSSSNDGTSN